MSEPIASAAPTPAKLASAAGPAEVAATRIAGASIITLRGAAVALGERTIWHDATLDIAPGEFVAVLGPNGAGKSTLLRVLLGLLRPSAGRVLVAGEPPRRGNSTIGYVPQQRSLDPDLSIRGRDLVALGIDGHRWGFALPGVAQRQRRALVDEALAAVESSAYADRPVGQLSGGEQQRLLLAQALVGQPRLLLLDEPLASLDLRNQRAMAQLVARVARERDIAVLLVAHDVNPLLPVLDRVLYVARGGIAIGPPDDIITADQLSALYGAPIDVLRDRDGRVFVVGLEDETTHTHAGD